MEGWKQFFDSEGYAYYNNAATGETLWEQEYNERLEQMKQKEAPPPPPPPERRKNLQVPARTASSPTVNNNSTGNTLRLPFQRGNESTSAPSSVATSPNLPHSSHSSPQLIPPKAAPPPIAKPSPIARPIQPETSAPAPTPVPRPVVRPTGKPSPQPSFYSPPAEEKPAPAPIPPRAGPSLPPKRNGPLPPPNNSNNSNNDNQRTQLASSNPIPVAPRIKQSLEPQKYGSAPGRTNEASTTNAGESDRGGAGSVPKSSGGSGAKSIIEQKLKSDFKPNYQLKTMGSHISIGLPTAVVQTGGFASENFSWAMNGSLIMQGELFFERAGDWQPRYCMIEEGSFQLYKSSTDQLAEMSFPLKGCTYDLNLGTNRSHAWKLQRPDGTALNFSANSKPEFEHWSSAIKINGANDGPLVQADKALREKKIKDAERRQEKEYVEAKKKDILTFNTSQNQAASSRAQAAGLSNPADAVSNVSIEDLSGELFKIRVTFDHQTWFIYRTEKEMSNLYSAMVTSMLSPVRLDNLRGIYPKKQKGQELKPMIPIFDSILNQLNNERRRIFSDKNLRYHYSRFFGPVKMGDTKPPGFIMPFEIELS